MSAQPNFAPHPEVAWSVEARGISLIRHGSGQRLFLAYPEAALWDFIVRRVPHAQISRMYSALAQMPAPAAEPAMNRLLLEWVEGGWLREKEPHG